MDTEIGDLEWSERRNDGAVIFVIRPTHAVSAIAELLVAFSDPPHIQFTVNLPISHGTYQWRSAESTSTGRSFSVSTNWKPVYQLRFTTETDQQRSPYTKYSTDVVYYRNSCCSNGSIYPANICDSDAAPLSMKGRQPEPSRFRRPKPLNSSRFNGLYDRKESTSE